ncbi:Acetylornithine aminotransferase [Gracilariopsis chorda]|uniref:acetylornithine transaminase n=1 Tax=Gracilariopsis chorda TaxID=448386 RepID=A0A2V3ILB1_9FLOR|nr:Acetylornithine aminotransferase [Gracilariopsis chorda]|eukprot:PXF41920.1 Acetylornithine aminotransferase [Gracilariopsis chorda]
MALAFSLSTPLAARPFLVSGASSPFAPRQPSPRSAAIRAPVKAVAAQPQQSPAPPDLDSVVMNTYARYAVAMSHGNGAELFDTRGKRYLDCVAGIATCTLGHAHPALIKAVTNQMSRVNHVSNLYYIPEQAALAAWLVSNSPADKVFFCNSGGEANEAAIKLARKYWHIRHGSDPTNIPVIITAHQSFHGRTLATLTATGQPKYHRNWWPLVPGFQYVTYNDAAELKQLADSIGDNLAAILMEACQGEGGIHPASKQFFATARQICDDTGALLMCDEVQVGVGRTGKLWGFDHTGVQPDVFTLAKGLGGGVPIGAMCCTAKCDVFEPGDHASTFGGNPLATAAGLAVANQLDSGVLQNAEQRGAQLMTGLQNLARKFSSVVKEVRGLGLILGVELQGIAASDVVAKAMDRGLLLVPAGKHVVRFVPPLVISHQQVESVLSIFETVLSDVAA